MDDESETERPEVGSDGRSRGEMLLC
uniref:Uncharacterized protein n=1 Tax=Arundo donax TaxID=35708 RepID=A0A0A8ZVE3_ARUDO